jgi:hypothetical protein
VELRFLSDEWYPRANMRCTVMDVSSMRQQVDHVTVLPPCLCPPPVPFEDETLRETRSYSSSLSILLDAQ